MSRMLRTADLTNILSPPVWMAEAACAEVGGDEWFPDKGGSPREAKRICARCPVSVECLDYALTHDERFGIWGGTSENERRRLQHPTPNRSTEPPPARQHGRLGAALLDEVVALGYARPVGGGGR